MKIIFIILAIIIIGIGGLYFGRNFLVETSVESGSTYALGVDTDLGSAQLEISGGSLTLNDYEISNPDGYQTDNFLVIKSGILDVNEGSILDDDIIIDSLIIDGIELNFEQVETRTNVQEIGNNIKNLDVASSDNGTKRFHIKKIAIRNISVSTLFSILDQKVEKKFDVDDFNLSNIGEKNGLTVGELSALIVKKISVKVFAEYSKLPQKKFMQDLKEKATDAVKDISGDASEKIEELGKSLLGK